MNALSKTRKVVFDIDGTLSDATHRHHFVQREQKDWANFFANQIHDPVREDVVEVLNMYLQLPEVHIALLTGRGEEWREVTERWLDMHDISYHSLTMRALGDRTDDDIIKLRVIKEWEEEGWDIIGLFDDRKRICDAARAHGITVFQMAEGNF
jgi:phosphoglycolate phosphatase-like HAD superfamily hydrolase